VCIREVAGSNLGWNFDYPDWDPSWSSSDHQSKFWRDTLHSVATACFYFLSCSVFADITNMRR
jgi:hypothetical protein